MELTLNITVTGSLCDIPTDIHVQKAFFMALNLPVCIALYVLAQVTPRI